MVTLGLAGRGHCWLCGMSHAFRAIWRGDFAEAVSYNSHSCVVFSVLIVGWLVGAVVSVYSLRTYCRPAPSALET
jgi:hypothetical protein